MHRISIYALLVLLLTFASAGQSRSGAKINFSFYAPTQKNAPVRILDFEHDQSEVWFVLSNTSDKSVVAIAIGRVDIVPRGCSTDLGSDPYWPVKNATTVGFKVNIVPHGKSIATKAGIQMIGNPQPIPAYPHLPRMVVDMAKRAKVGYMQVQFGITGVLFGDGTSWPAQAAVLLREDFDPFRKPYPADASTAMTAINHPDPFDGSLVEAEVEKCADVATVANALQSAEEIVFDRESPIVSNVDNVADVLPQLHFSCSLAGSKAVCRLPLESDPHREMQGRADTGWQ